jgi:hypothetical protein
MSLEKSTARMTNTDLAKALEFIASGMKGGISDALLREAAKRLRADPEPCFVMSPAPDLPPLKAYAIPDLPGS